MTSEFIKDFRRFFIRGLTAFLPTILTIAIFIWVCTFVYDYIARYTNMAAKWIIVQFVSLLQKEEFSWAGPQEIVDNVNRIWKDYTLVWIGFVLAFVLIYVFGRLINSFIGRGAWATVERTFFRLPAVKQVYPSVKQVTDFLFSEQKLQFSRVVAVQYPRKGIWSVGLVTAPGMKILQTPDCEYLTVFIPSSPMPVTGYTVTVRRDEVIDLPLNIDDALKFTVSGGVVTPPSQQLDQDTIQRLTGTQQKESAE